MLSFSFPFCPCQFVAFPHQETESRFVIVGVLFDVSNYVFLSNFCFVFFLNKKLIKQTKIFSI